MSTTTLAGTAQPPLRKILNKVPEVTMYFWVIKVLATTVGETFADFLNTNLGLGLTGTSLAMGAALLTVLFFQFRAHKYVPTLYWLAVVLISVVGTLITDNLVENVGVSLVTCSIIFGIGMLATFAIWYSRERTLSIHEIDSLPREAWYWTAILFTFALGTATGDLLAEHLKLGYGNSVLLFLAAIGLVLLAWKYLGANAVGAFWVAYVLTRPLGASTGDLLSQPKDAGGLGWGTTVTSAVFLAAIVIVVSYMTSMQKRKAIAAANG